MHFTTALKKRSMGGWENEKCDQSYKQRETFSHETFQYQFLVLSVTTLSKVLDVLVYLKFLTVHCCWRYHLN